MQVDKYSISTNTNDTFVLDFEYENVVDLPLVRSAMFVDSGINIASYTLIDDTESILFNASREYVGINERPEDAELDPFFMNVTSNNSTSGRTTFYYGDLTDTSSVGSAFWLSPTGDKKVDGDTDITTGGVNVDDLTLALRMFVDDELYKGTKDITVGSGKKVTRIQRALVYADTGDTSRLEVHKEYSGFELNKPLKSFELSKLRHILKIVNLALNIDTVTEYKGVVDATQDDSGNLVVKTSGLTGSDVIRVYFTNDDDTLLSDKVKLTEGGTGIDFKDYSITDLGVYDSASKKFTLPIKNYIGFDDGTHAFSVTGISSSLAVGIYCSVSSKQVVYPTWTATVTNTATPTETVTITDSPPVGAATEAATEAKLSS